MQNRSCDVPCDVVKNNMLILSTNKDILLYYIVNMRWILKSEFRCWVTMTICEQTYCVLINQSVGENRVIYQKWAILQFVLHVYVCEKTRMAMRLSPPDFRKKNFEQYTCTCKQELNAWKEVTDAVKPKQGTITNDGDDDVGHRHIWREEGVRWNVP